MLGLAASHLGYGSQVALAESHFVVLLVRMVVLHSAPIGAIALSLSFLPPGRYLGFIRRHATNSSPQPNPAT